MPQSDPLDIGPELLAQHDQVRSFVREAWRTKPESMRAMSLWCSVASLEDAAGRRRMLERANGGFLSDLIIFALIAVMDGRKEYEDARDSEDS